MAKLYYIHDPMCSWCWAFAPVMAQIESALSGQLTIEYVLGGLAADTDEPMSDDTRQMVQSNWKRIEQEVGLSFNYDFWSKCQPRRATYPACRAVIAASYQHAEKAMIAAIQQAYYLRAMNPSEEDTLLQLADEMGLDFDRFMQDLESPKCHEQLLAQIQQSRQMGVNSFPSLLLEHNGFHRVPHDYHSVHSSLAYISDQLK